MKKVTIISALIVLVTLGLYATQKVGIDGPRAKKEMKPLSKSLLAINTAMDLVRYGYDNHCASCLVNAAEILSKNPTAPLKYEKLNEEKGLASTKNEKKSFTDVKTLLEDAVTMDKSVEEIAKKVVIPEVTRGAVGGPQYATGKVNGKAELYYEIKFYANETATVVVKGDGDTDLDLYVHDMKGNLITKDTNASDECVVSFTPYYTTTFQIYIVNRGSVYNKYALVTN